MHPRLVELFVYVDQEHADLTGTVQKVPAPLLPESPGPERWSVAQVLEHLVLTERQIARLLARLFSDAVAKHLPAETDTRPILAAIDTRRITDRSIRSVAIESLRPPGELTAAESLEALAAARVALEESARIGSGLALTQVVYPHPTLGPLNGYEWLAFVGAHMARHHEQIRETVRLLSRMPYQ
jgi:DinB superfamily